MRTFKNDPETKIGAWLLDNMIKNKMTCADVARELHTTRQIVAYHVNGRTTPSSVWVKAYCDIFNDDVEKIWKLVES